MSQFIDLYKNACKSQPIDLVYQTNVFIELLKTTNTKKLYEIGPSYGYFSLLAGSHNWSVTAFEPDPHNYSVMCHNICTHHLESKIAPIYTHIGLNPSLDHFIGDQQIGIVKINAEGETIEIVTGLKRSLQKRLIGHLIINVYPRLRPTNFWIELIVHLEQQGFRVFHLRDTGQNIKLIPFKMDELHKIPETTLLFTEQSLVKSDEQKNPLM